MKPEQKEFLSLRRLPGFLSKEQASWRLGVEEHEVDILMHMKKLPPLGGAEGNMKKQFSASALERLLDRDDWPDEARAAIIEFWAKKNSQRTTSEKPSDQKNETGDQAE
jgi:hypothetical protein